MRQKLSKPSNSSRVSKANRQGNNNGKLFPNESKFFKANIPVAYHLPKKSDIDSDAIAEIHELIDVKTKEILPKSKDKLKE